MQVLKAAQRTQHYMNVTEIPFNRYITISKSISQKSTLELAFNENMKNHIGTFHASPQFALAEACSGLALKDHFPELANSVVPVLRKTETKFKKPTTLDINASANITDSEKSKFISQFEKKGRASICVEVEVKDEQNTVTMVGRYDWFIQKI